jgi:hypothetical protein
MSKRKYDILSLSIYSFNYWTKFYRDGWWWWHIWIGKIKYYILGFGVIVNVSFLPKNCCPGDGQAWDWITMHASTVYLFAPCPYRMAIVVYSNLNDKQSILLYFYKFRDY